MSTPVTTIAVIVPTLGNRDLTRLKQALHCQTRLADDFIVIEDRSRRGGAWARNRGIEQSSAQLLVFLDDDCIPPPQWLETLAAAIDRHGAAGAGGTYDEEDPLLRSRRSRQNYPEAEVIDQVGWVGAGGNVAYRRDVLENIRLRDGHCFNEEFRIAEDKELAWRVRTGGWALVFVPVRVSHTKRCKGWAYVRQQFGRGIGIAALYRAGRRSHGSAAPDRGLLWARRGRPGLATWLRVSVRKALGPFDRRSFQSASHYFFFWIGEKIQGLGFLWELARQQFVRR